MNQEIRLKCFHTFQIDQIDCPRKVSKHVTIMTTVFIHAFVRVRQHEFNSVIVCKL